MLHEHKINIPSQRDKIAIFRWSWINGWILFTLARKARMRQRYFLSFRRIIRDRFAVATVAIAMSRYCACHRRGSRSNRYTDNTNQVSSLLPMMARTTSRRYFLRPYGKAVT